MTAARWFPMMLLLVAAACLSLTGGAGTADPKPDDKQSVDSKAEKRSPATAIDFKKELQLPFPTLGTLGARVEAARKAPDPVALAHTAGELAVAEKVSGKTASLTSQTLIQESAELAKLRRQVAEMKAVLNVSNQIANQEQLAMNLNAEIDRANQWTKEEKEAIQMGKAPTAAPRRVLVNNYTTQYADIYVNGYYKMQVGPGQSSYCVIEHKWNPTILRAYGNEDITNWGPRYIWGTFDTYTWNLN
jgi:hypothetical protein